MFLFIEPIGSVIIITVNISDTHHKSAYNFYIHLSACDGFFSIHGNDAGQLIQLLSQVNGANVLTPGIDDSVQELNLTLFIKQLEQSE